MSNRLVSIIIVTRKIEAYLRPCLDSIKKQAYSAFEIIVIDNSLNPGFSQDIIRHYPEVKLPPSLQNISYCEALNKGINLSSGYFILCLNDDVILHKDFTEEILKVFNIDARIGMVSGKILRSDKKTLDSTGLFLSIWRTAKERGYGCEDKGQYEKEGYIFGVNGAVAFYRKAMLEEIKVDSDYFDSDYHFFYEDLDTAWRGQNFGWKAYYAPKAVAYHVRGATARSSNGKNKPCARRFLSNELHNDLIKNRYLTMIKNEAALDFFLHLPAIMLYDLIMWVYILIFRTQLVLWFPLNLKYIKNAFKKRRAIIIKR